MRSTPSSSPGFVTTIATDRSRGAMRATTSTNQREGRSAAATAVLATLAIAAACWVIAVRRMSGMDMGVGTALGSFGFFVGMWIPMMAAMMLPGAAPAVFRRARTGGVLRAVPLFLVSYIAVWALAGVAVYAIYRPHGTAVAGAAAIAAGAYELTPVK